ncbi:Fungalysin/Thermolysin Extracellular metalloproteinase 5 [Phlyctochytrium planicorne]|nr:Fungalysin/Thermolysin Extracellular metalloproteinase 5 [Phlyctochytrium planicorne]
MSMDSSMTRDTRRVAGAYQFNRAVNGIRTRPYSTSLAVNNMTYLANEMVWDPHYIGEIWSTTLYEVYWGMVEQAGFTPNIMEPFDPSGIRQTPKPPSIPGDMGSLKPTDADFLGIGDGCV